MNKLIDSLITGLRNGIIAGIITYLALSNRELRIKNAILHEQLQLLAHPETVNSNSIYFHAH